MVLLLSEVCDVLALNEKQRAVVLGPEGERALTAVLERRPVPRPQAPVNGRQTKALDFVEQRGAINLAAYRRLCPDWSNETLRRAPSG